MKVLTPYEVALRMMGNGRDAGLIAAYLAEEARRAGHDDPLRLSPHPNDRVRYLWGDIKNALRPLAAALERFVARPEFKSDYALVAEALAKGELR